MAKTDYRSVDEYIAAQPAPSRPILERVRSAIRKAVPDADELISYQIPAYKLHGQRVLYFAGWKDHYSLYPATPATLAAFREELTPYEVEKATIRFPLARPVPTRLIGQIAKFRAKEAVAGKKIKPAAMRS